MILSLVLTLGGSFICKAQKMTSEMKQKVITRINEQMQKYYVFPKVADKMAEYLQQQFKAQAYKDDSPREFGNLLTRDLQKISKDKHIRVKFDPKMAKQLSPESPQGPDPELIRKIKTRAKRGNYGFAKVEVLPGNVGYVDLRAFMDPEDGAKTVESVMGFLANTEGVIFDVRNNGGGRPDMVQLICSYFFGKEPVHLNSLYWRVENDTQEFWTLKDIKGARMPNKPLYVLTSKRTFSAAEEFSYNLQSLKRATLVGETTGGGANPGGRFPIERQFWVFIPVGRAINPITKTNWEGVGVVPQLKVSSDQALDKAYLDLLQKLKSKEEVNHQVDWALAGLEAKLHPKTIASDVLKSYAGDFTNYKIVFKNNQLYCQRPRISKKFRKLVPIGNEVFAVEGIPDFRIEFKKADNGKVTGLEGLHISGRRSFSKRGHTQR